MKNAAIWIVVGLAVLGAGLATVWVLNRGGGNPVSAASSVEGAPPSDSVRQVPSEAVAAENPGQTLAETTSAAGESEQTQGEVQPTSSTEPAPVQAAAAMPAEVAVEELIENGDTYEGREVLVKGTIITQCMRGCRFAIDDGTGVINVELVEKALDRLISQGSVGKQVEATGVFHQAPRPLVAVEKPENWDFLR